MIVDLAQYLGEDILTSSQIITEVSKYLQSYFEPKFYGAGLKEIVIGIVCVPTQFEQFFPIGKPIYTKEKAARKVDFEIILDRTLEYRAKLDYASFKNASVDKAKELLALSILESLDVFNKVKIPDFDCYNFRADLVICFKFMNII